MVTLTIDGEEITVEKGTSILQAAERVGIYIPRYCYHPALSVAGNCRMCLVEVEKMPKPVISCQTQCQDGMVVYTNNEKVKNLRRSVLEFLLINHPLDCPVCDQAGECFLQDYYMEYGLFDSRFNETKVKKSKAVPIGKNVMLDSERCILCGRCVRFTSEITGTNELGIFKRGDHSEVGAVPGKTLDNPYSGNVVDICPVGALTDRDFRFKCRVWYLKSQDSICPGCSRGCNIRIDFNLDRSHHGDGARVMRLKPRENKDVNQYWMCDEGRYGYKFIDENRILNPEKRKGDELVPSSWKEVVSGVKKILADGEKDETGIIVSTHLTNEDLYAVYRFFKTDLGFKNIDYRLPVPDGESDDFLRATDKSPNTRAAHELFKGAPLNANEIILKARKGQIKTLIVFGYDLEEIYGEKTCRELSEALENIVFIGSNWNGTAKAADYVLPSATYAEKDGSFTNFEGRVQRVRKVFDPIGASKAEWEILGELARDLDREFPYKKAEELLVDLSGVISDFSEMNFKTIETGAFLKSTEPKKKTVKGKKK